MKYTWLPFPDLDLAFFQPKTDYRICSGRLLVFKSWAYFPSLEEIPERISIFSEDGSLLAILGCCRMFVERTRSSLLSCRADLHKVWGLMPWRSSLLRSNGVRWNPWRVFRQGPASYQGLLRNFREYPLFLIITEHYVGYHIDDHLVGTSSNGRSHLTERMNVPWTFLSYVLGIIRYPPFKIGLSPPTVVSRVIDFTGRKLVWEIIVSGE